MRGQSIVAEAAGIVARISSPGAKVAGELSIWFYHPETGNYQETPPYGVNLGDTIGFYAFGENTSSRVQRMRIVVRLYDPDGVLIDSSEREADVNAGGVFSSYTLEGIVAKTGDYTGEAKLYAE